MRQVADRPISTILGRESTLVEQHPGNGLDGVERHAVGVFEDEPHREVVRQARELRPQALGHDLVA